MNKKLTVGDYLNKYVKDTKWTTKWCNGVKLYDTVLEVEDCKAFLEIGKSTFKDYKYEVMIYLEDNNGLYIDHFGKNFKTLSELIENLNNKKELISY